MTFVGHNPHATCNIGVCTAHEDERMFCCLKDWRRIATRYDKLASNFAAAVAVAAVILRWT